MSQPETTLRPYAVVWHRRVRRAVLVRRRPLAAVAAALAVVATVQAAAPPAPPTRPVLTAVRDLSAGEVIGSDDVAPALFPPGAVPSGALTAVGEATGRTTTGPVRAGEPITDVRLLSGSLLDGYPGRVAAPVRIVDPGAVALLRIGDVVDVVAADPQGRREASVVARDVPVLALPRAAPSQLASGGLVVLAVTEETASGLAAAAVSAYLSLVITR